MLIYGAGGYAKVIIAILKANNEKVTAIFDDDNSKKDLLQIPITGFYKFDFCPNEKLIIAIGNNVIRKSLSEKIGHACGIAIHPSALVDESVQIGEGTCVMQNAVIQIDSKIGKHVIINTSVSVDHDGIIEDFVHLAPGVTLAGNVHIGENTLIGVGSIVAPGIKIGKDCLVSTGSVVTKNIPDGCVIRGNPARIIRQQ